MLTYPHFNPIAFEIGPLKVHWYGLMYLLAFAMAWGLGRYRIKKGNSVIQQTSVFEDLMFYGILGVVLGGRLGYVLFYQPGFYFYHPQEIIAVWDGGMSFHGGMLGVLLVIAFFSYRLKIHFLQLTDFIAPLIPLGLGAGRMGNFINGELWGRPTDLPWGMVFPTGGPVPRHPSQLYEMALEGVVLFLILWIYSRKPRAIGKISALFLIGYGAFRFLVEFAREPDSFLGELALGLSMGQWLSLPMIIVGIVMFVWASKRA